MLMPESVPRLIAESPACEVLEMLHSWWLANCHLDKLQSQHRLKTQDVEKHRETALEYLKYFESTVLPSEATEAPRGTRIQRVEELWRYRYDSLQHYEKLKAWLDEGEQRLDFIKAHLARTLAAMQGCQVNVPDANTKELRGRDAELHKALYDLLQQHHESLLEWKESQVESNEGGSVASASAKKLRSDAEAKQSAKPQEESLTNADANSKGSNQGCPKPQDANQAVYGKGEPADAVKLQHQLQKEQERVRALEGRLKDANRASEYHRVEMQRMQACLQAGQRVSKINEEAFEEAERHEEEMNKEHTQIMAELQAARQAARQAEHLVLEQALELDRAHITNATLAQVNNNLQAQVTNLQGDNFSFQSRVTSLQETTSSLSTQINALAQQAQTAASVSNQVKVLKNVAASLQRERDVAQKERDAAKSDAQKAEQEHTTLSAKVADLTRQLNNASSQIKGMSKSDGSPKQDISAKGKGNTRNETANPQQDGGKPVPKQGGAQSGSMTDAQAAAYEATITQLKEQLQAGNVMNFKHALLQEKAQLQQDVEATKEVRQEGKHVDGELIKSARALSPQSTLPAPQISPASPSKSDSSSG